ncbi:hypothetical protein [Rhizobium sp. BK251]|uniref:hypothetical protein n=1 Tax=Rhizobium sp. BK251 TaxID=2512125 RepID=UPI0010EA2746|nr:hypothetical protein [Rhizobium sp. BK251]TCL70466.1 hypothetical protein EV286_107340 [Rhizobium sp. BK251]
MERTDWQAWTQYEDMQVLYLSRERRMTPEMIAQEMGRSIGSVQNRLMTLRSVDGRKQF